LKEKHVQTVIAPGIALAEKILRYAFPGWRSRRNPLPFLTGEQL
jgi:hypothetical protein